MDRSRDVWFFSRDGRQSGPLTYRDLKEKADEGVLLPDYDYVWKEGMQDWCLIGKIEGLFEPAAAPTPEPAPSPAAPAPTAEAPVSVITPVTPAPAAAQEPPEEPLPSPEEAPPAGPAEVPEVREIPQPGEIPAAPPVPAETPSSTPPMADEEEVAHTPSGAGRRTFIAVTVFLPLLWLAAASQVVETGDPAILFLMFVAAPLAIALVSFLVTLLRFSHLGMKRWWVFGLLVPLLQLWLGYRLFACPAGYAGSRKQDPGGIALAVIYWLLVALSAAGGALASTSPEKVRQLGETLEPLLGRKPHIPSPQE